MREIEDAAFTRSTIYYLPEVEVFKGHLDGNYDKTEGRNVDQDGLWLEFDRAGRYRVVLTQTSNKNCDLFLDINDPQQDGISIETDGSVEVILNIAGATKRFALIGGDPDIYGPRGRYANTDYEVSLEYIGPLEPDVSFDAFYDPDRPVDDTPFVEKRDLPEKKITKVLAPGDTLIGSLTEDDHDKIAFAVEEGVAYTVWLTGTGVNPMINGYAYGKGDHYWVQTATTFVAEFTGNMGFRIASSYIAGADPDAAADYSFTLAVAPHLDETRDAPADSTTPYSIGKDGVFYGTLTEYDEDWIAVRLIEGHTYSITMNRESTITYLQPLILNKNGKALTWAKDDGASYAEYATETVFTPTHSGKYYIQPQYRSYRAEGEYTLAVEDFGELGLVETIDAKYDDTNKVIYSFQSGETFHGSLDENDRDSITLKVTRDGYYALQLRKTDGPDKAEPSLSLHFDPYFFAAQFAYQEDGKTNLFFYAYAGTEYVVSISDEVRLNFDYDLTAKWLAEIDLDETTDLPPSPNDVLVPIEVGETFKGYIEGNEDFDNSEGEDYIPFAVEQGKIYVLTLSGFGKRMPSDANSLYVHDSDGELILAKRTNTPYLIFDADKTDTYFASQTAEARTSFASVGFYKLTFDLYDGLIRGTDQDDFLPGTRIADRIFGGAGDDTLNGGDGNDRLYGQNGRDVIGGGGGADRVSGGKKSDTLYGGDGNDRLSGGNGADILFGNEGDDLLSGGSSADSLEGQEGNDRLFGGKGDDRLFGGEGWDELYGGDGADTFVFSRDSSRFKGPSAIDYSQIDLIQDYSILDDNIVIYDNTSTEPEMAELISSVREIEEGQTVRITGLLAWDPGYGEYSYSADVIFENAGILLQVQEKVHARYLFVANVQPTELFFDTISLI